MKRFRVLIIALAVIAVAGIGITGYGLWRARRWWRELQERDAVAAEMPTVEELRGPGIPDDENAALVYELAWEALELSDEDDEALGAGEDDEALGAGEDLEALAEIVERNEEALALASEAAAIERCRFEPEIDESGFPEFPHLKHMRMLSRLVLRDALVCGHAGDVDAAMAGIFTSLHMSRHTFEDSDNLICFLVGVSLLHRSVKALEQNPAFTAAKDRPVALRVALRDLDPAASLQRSLRMERAYALAMLDDLEKDPARFVSPDERNELARRRPNLVWPLIVEMNRVKYMELTAKIMERSKLPWRELAAEAPPEDLAEDLGAPYMFTTLLLPVFGQVPAKRDECLARIELAVVALDLTTYRHEHGRFPETLDELPDASEPDYAVDPFSGERLHYRPEDGGFVLWSLGPDLDDDGAFSRREACEDEQGDSDDHDLVFRRQG